MDGGGANHLAGNAACFGRADTVDTAVITGWFVAPARGAAGDRITAFIDGEPAGQAVATTACNLSEGAPGRACGFSYSIPFSYQDGRSHTLSLTLADGTAIEFPTRGGVTRSNMRFRFQEQNSSSMRGGPEETQAAALTPNAADSQYAGLADPPDNGTVTGWAICRGVPDQRVALRVFVDGRPAGEAVCDQPHDALRALGLPTGGGGFSFVIPDRFLDGSAHSLTVLFDDGRPLAFKTPDGGTQDRVEFATARTTFTEGFVDGLHGGSIRGWVVRRHSRTGGAEGCVSVQVLCNGSPVGEIVADRPRVDVAREYGCDPSVGFEFRLPESCRGAGTFEFVFRALPEGDELAGSPLPVRQRSMESADELLALSEAVDELCAKAFKLQRHMREMLPNADATVLCYDGWGRRHQARLRTRMAAAEPMTGEPPLISIVMPTFQPNLAHLTAAIESVRAQTYQAWELIVVDDGSRHSALAACLKNYAALDGRIACVIRREKLGAGAAINAGLRKARGAYVVLFDPDALMVEVALDAMAREALRTAAKIVYSDEDKIDAFGALSEPMLKPDWNYRLLLGVNYVRHLVMVDRGLLRLAGPMRADCEGAEHHDLLLRLAENCEPGRIAHLPEILYHGRTQTGSAVCSDAQARAVAAGRQAVSDHLARRGFTGHQVVPHGLGPTYRVSWGLEERPSVTIIIPFKDQIAATRRCLEALLASTDWERWRVVLVDNGSVTPEAREFCKGAALHRNVTVRRVDEAFNYARLNNIAAAEFPADWYLFLNNDVFLEQRDWLRVMMAEALSDPQVAVVGVKLVYPNGTVQHAGVVLGVGGVADHAFRGLPAGHPGYLNRARCAQQYSAVTGACMLCRADVFWDVGGFDERDLAVTFNDVDLCLKIGSRGWHVVWTPDVVAEHHESLSRGDDIAPGKAHRSFYETSTMLERWRGIINADPHYNPHFSRHDGIFSDLRCDDLVVLTASTAGNTVHQ